MVEEGFHKRTRSRLGCLTCRKRKKRCDEERPVCGTCLRLSLDCSYPAPGEERKNKRRRSILEPIRSLGRDKVVNVVNLEQVEPVERVAVPLVSSGESVPPIAVPTGPVHEAPIPMVSAVPMLEQMHEKREIMYEPYTPTDSDPQDPTVVKPVADIHYDILSPLFRFEDAFAGDTPFTMPDFSLPSQLMLSDSKSTHSMIARLNENHPELDSHAVRLFTYFCDTQSQLMSVSPQNNFKGIFAEMAIKNEPVLYALLSWAAFHNSEAMGSGDLGDTLGHRFLNKAAELVSDPMLYEFSASLAALLLIASAHICSGDMRNWRQYLEAAANLIKKRSPGGIDFDSEEQYWLLKNFAYHDILAFGNRKRPLLLPKELHNRILNYKSDVLPDTLCACCQPVFIILASITDFCREIHEGNVGVGAIQAKASELLMQLDTCAPNRELLLPLSYMDAKEQLNLFNLFQQLARVVVHNLILRLNAASIPMQIMNEELLKKLASVIGTRGEGATIFPLFIAGITASSTESRSQVMLWLSSMYERHSARNIARSKALIREVWARDENGHKHVDWNHLAEVKGWNLSFA